MAGVLPLSWPQEGLWFFEQATPNTATYNIAEAWWLDGALNLSALQYAVNEIVRRHESLRTALGSKDGKPCQIVFPPKPFPLSVTDLRLQASGEAEAVRLAGADARKSFDLTQEPLMRVSLFRVSDRKNLLAINMHHIISDAWSVGVFLRELAALYKTFDAGRESDLPELPIQYGNFALWQREMSQSDQMREGVEFWKKQLAGAPPLTSFPGDRPRPAMTSHRGTALFANWPEPLAAKLKDFARKEGSTVYQVLLSAFAILLQRATLQEDLVIGSPFSGRDELETENLIGFFVNTRALRIGLAGNPTFAELLKRVRETSMSAGAGQQPPLHYLVRALGGERNLAANSLFQVAFGLQRDFSDGWTIPGLNASRVELESGAAKFDFTLLVTEGRRHLDIRIEYSTDLYDAPSIERWAKQYRVLVENILANSALRISEFELETDTEREKSMKLGLGAANEYERDACAHELFEKQVAKNPAAIALVCEDGEIAYGELNHRANLVAAKLTEAGAGVETVIGLCVERSLDMIVALIAILKTGAVYLPLDPANPASRNAMMLEDSKASLVVTRERYRGAIPAPGEQILCLDNPNWPVGGGRLRNSPVRAPKATDMAYIMYTSGSTGRPKGVAVTHRGIGRLVRNTDFVEFSPNDVFLQLATLSFDASTFEIWGALANGAKLVLHPPQMPSLEELGHFVQRHKITTLWLTSGWFNQMIDNQLASLQGLRFLLAGGEALSVPHVLKAVRELKNTQFINGYGPTENTTFTCCYRVPKNWAGRASVPIGRPIANTQIYILDAAMRPVAQGAIGEIYIGGDGVARGYVNRPELTDSKFVHNPFGPEHLYRTGDLARWLPDGNVEFIGRKDEQVKIRGFRVEPGEIEAALMTHESVREALVVAREDHSGTKQLVAYVVLRADTSPASLQLREFLSIKLPSYMVPSHIVPMDKLPLTPNGKVDRRALPAPEELAKAEAEACEAPRNPTEILLADIWREILGRDRIGINDNFFHLGGHSLLATQIVSRIAKALQIELPVRVIFESPTVAGMAREVVSAERQTASQPGIELRRNETSRAQRLLDRIDELSDSEVEELLLELDEKELK